jgi:hypothetical protein
MDDAILPIRVRLEFASQSIADCRGARNINSSLTSAYVMVPVNACWQKPVSVKYASNSGLGLGGLERHVGLYSKPMIILDFLVESFMPLQGA